MTARPLREQRPHGTLWSRSPLAAPVVELEAIAASQWRRRAVSVISALEVADYPRGGGAGPQWHVSIAAGVGEGELRRVTAAELRVALVAFGMVGAEEDNQRRADCECKDDEVTVTEPDGYTWTNPHDPAECRGCELAGELGKVCPIHGEVRR